MRTTARPRYAVSAPALAVLRPLFRYSAARDAYVLRAVGNRRGPVLVRGAGSERDARFTKTSSDGSAGQP